MATFDQRKFQFFKEREERSILIKIRFQLYEISTDVLLEVFSTRGNIETVTIFRSGEEFHSKVCFEDQDSTIRALDWYNDRYIYGQCCQLELFQASQFIDRSSKIKVPTQEVEDVLEIPAMPEIGERQRRMEEIPIKGDDIQIAQDSPGSFNRNFKAPSESVLGDSGVDLIANGVSKFETPYQKVFEDERSTQTLDFAMVDDSRDWKVEVDAPVADLSHVGAPIANANLEIQIQFGSEMDDVKKPPNPEIPEPSKVNSDPSETPPVDYTTEKLGELVVLFIELMEIRLDSAKKISRTGLTGDSMDNLGNFNARKMFAKMIETKFVLSRMCVGQSSLDQNFTSGGECYCLDLASGVVLVYDPGGTILSRGIHQDITEFARAGESLVVLCDQFVRRYRDSFCEQRNHVSSLPFDRGRVFNDSISYMSAATLEIGGLSFVFDPGGSDRDWMQAFGMNLVFDPRGEFVEIGRGQLNAEQGCLMLKLQ